MLMEMSVSVSVQARGQAPSVLGLLEGRPSFIFHFADVETDSERASTLLTATAKTKSELDQICTQKNLCEAYRCLQNGWIMAAMIIPFKNFIFYFIF